MIIPNLSTIILDSSMNKILSSVNSQFWSDNVDAAKKKVIECQNAHVPV